MIVSLLIIIIIHINIISIYSLLHILSNVLRKDAKVICRGIAFFFFSFSFILSLHLCFFVGRCPFLPPRKKMNLVGFFFPGDYLTYICYTVYIHNVYKHYKQYIYYTYIFVHIPRISSRWLACHLSFSICLSIALVYLSFFLFSPENITKIYA